MREVRTIALVDHTRKHRPPDGVLEAIAEALTIQVQRDFAPAWGVEAARFTVGGRGDKIHFGDTLVPVSDFVLPAYFNPWAEGPYDHLRVLDDAFSIDTGGYAVFQRTSAEHERLGRGFGVTFDDAMPQWQRTLKLRGWG